MRYAGRRVLGQRFRIPAGALLLPALAGAVLQSSGTVALQVPEWLLAAAYTLIGWTVGLRFTLPIFRLALRTLPQMLASIAGLMLLCGGMAWILTKLLHVDLLTAYLATSPAGWIPWRLLLQEAGSISLSSWRCKRCGCLPFCLPARLWRALSHALPVRERRIV